MSLEDIALFLQKFGGWGVATILFVAIVYLYRSMNKTLDKRNEQFIEALKETTAALQQNSDESRRVEQVLQRVERHLDNQ